MSIFFCAHHSHGTTFTLVSNASDNVGVPKQARTYALVRQESLTEFSPFIFGAGVFRWKLYSVKGYSIEPTSCSQEC